jgi:hypothetical protein
MKTYPTIDEAVGMARLMRQANQRHYSIKQRRSGCYSVAEERFVPHPAWSTRGEQREYSDHRVRKIEISDIPLILALAAENITINQIADKFDVPWHSIAKICDKYS